jgi:cell wall integrity and stress response component
MTLIAETTIIATPTNTSSSSGISGGAVAGIVIGILALIAIGAAITFFVRRRQRDEYQRQYDPSNLSSSPGSLNRPFGTDQRLEPQMLQKRESVGSLADENDYSRKILRVIS